MKRYDIGLAVYIIETFECHVSLCRARLAVPVIREHIHAHRVSYPAERTADTAIAYDADRLTRKLHERVIPKAPFAVFPAPIMHDTIMVSDPARDLQEQRCRVLCDGLCAVGWDVAYGDAALCRRLDVYDIVARREHADIAYRRTSVEYLLR